MKPIVPTVVAALMLSVSCVSPPSAPMSQTGMFPPVSWQSGQIPTGMGKLVIGRPSEWDGASAACEILINGKQIASLDNGSYVQLYAEVGTYEARIDVSILGISAITTHYPSRTITIEEGKTSYLEWRLNEFSFGKAVTFGQFPSMDYAGLRVEDPSSAAIYLDGSTVALGGTVHPPSPRRRKARPPLLRPTAAIGPRRPSISMSPRERASSRRTSSRSSSAIAITGTGPVRSSSP